MKECLVWISPPLLSPRPVAELALLTMREIVATVPTSGGSIDVTIEKTTSTAAFMVESGRTLSSTVLNNWASTWDSTVYPTLMTYFGKDYFDGRGIAAPDVDNNCQIEIVIYAIDGALQYRRVFFTGYVCFP